MVLPFSIGSVLNGGGWNIEDYTSVLQLLKQETKHALVATYQVPHLFEQGLGDENQA
jgi:hypothetical protein